MPTGNDLATTVSAYRKLGWDTFPDEHGSIMAGVGERFDVATFPDALAPAFLSELPDAPVFVDARIHRCTVLTSVACDQVRDVAPDLAEARVRALPRRTPVMLPVLMEDDWDGHRRWLVAPDAAVLPGWDETIAAIGRAIEVAR
ncbi:hypothetical protein [Alloactinosynnema sp. L-07]|nr:hypothetical protein [Alloactinosynnema sp. L-07]